MRTLGLLISLFLVEASGAQSPYTNHPANLLESNPILIQKNEACFSLAALRTTNSGAHLSAFFQNPYYQDGHGYFAASIAKSISFTQLKLGIQHEQFYKYRKQLLAIGIAKQISDEMNIGSLAGFQREAFPEGFTLKGQFIQLGLIKAFSFAQLYLQLGIERSNNIQSIFLLGLEREWNKILSTDISFSLDQQNISRIRLAVQVQLNQQVNCLLFTNSDGSIGLQISLQWDKTRFIFQQFQQAFLGSNSALGISWKQN